MHCTDEAQLRASMSACYRYIDNVKAYLADSAPRELPDADEIITSDVPESSLLKPKAGHDATGPYVAAFINPPEGKPPPTKPYLIDPWRFLGMRWLEIAGHGFRLNTASPDKLRYYIAWKGADNLLLRRIIMGPEKGKAVPDKGNYSDYREVSLRRVYAPQLAAITDYHINSPFRARPHLIDFFKDSRTALKLAGRGIDPAEYLQRLEEILALGDQMYERCYGNQP